jgi:hypothetical protein
MTSTDTAQPPIMEHLVSLTYRERLTPNLNRYVDAVLEGRFIGFVHASVILDGASTPLTGVDIVHIPHDQLRMGMRVRAVWRPEGQRTVEGISNRGWGGLDGVLEGFEPTGEPDAPPEAYQDHIF